MTRIKNICKLIKGGKIAKDFSDILYHFENIFQNRKRILHIISLNPENFVIAIGNRDFMKALYDAPIVIADGIGIVVAAKILYKKKINRIHGVDLFEFLLDYALDRRLRVLLIGGKNDIAEKIANCYNQRAQKKLFKGVEGFENIRRIKREEQSEIENLIQTLDPKMVFVAFGSPDQELWIEHNKALFTGRLVMGVGGGFDFVGGRVRRAPKILQNIGLEWFFRLILQPWRVKRQWRLIVFVFVILGCKIKFIFQSWRNHIKKMPL